MKKTKFNPEGKELLTFGESLSPAMKITDEEDARQYLGEYVEYIRGHIDGDVNEDGLTPEMVAKINLGYYAGYYDTTTQMRVEHLFECSHPIFGPTSREIQDSIEGEGE